VFVVFQGYMVRISGGNDKQGFPMKQGVLTTGRVRLLLSGGHSCYRPRRDGERRRKSVRGCIVDGNLSVLNLVIIKKGAAVGIFLCFGSTYSAVSALTLSVGHQEEHPACRKLNGEVWCGCLPGVTCRLCA